MKVLCIIFIVSQAALGLNFIVESNEPIEGLSVIAQYNDTYVSTVSDSSFADLYTTKGITNIYEDVILSVPETIQGPLSALSWNLDTVDGIKDKMYNYSYTGLGQTLYVIDTGIWPQAEFGNRIIPGKSFAFFEPGTLDCNGHGTHVSSTAVGKKYGIAKDAKVMPIRVFGCSGGASTSSVVQALYYITSLPKGVINMSLGGRYNTLMNKAVADAVAKGFVVVVAAGNDAGDAGNKSPASETSAITVGAMTESNTVSYFSNEGSSVDIFAPGSGILASFLNEQTKVWSGTSMASPLVAGVCLQILEKYPNSSPAQVAEILIGLAAEGTLSGFKNALSPNIVARTVNDDSRTPAPSLRPTCSRFGRKACIRRPRCRWNGRRCRPIA